ncbi:MAG: hypothetical protein DWH98_06520, partial [Planctomycetota bacterium]
MGSKTDSIFNRYPDSLVQLAGSTRWFNSLVQLAGSTRWFNSLVQLAGSNRAILAVNPCRQLRWPIGPI